MIIAMDDKKAAAILLAMLDKYQLSDEEKEAVKNAVGILGWTSLAQSRLKTMKERRDKKALR